MQMSQPNITDLSHILQDQADNSPVGAVQRMGSAQRLCEMTGAQSPQTGYRRAVQRFENRMNSPMTARVARFKSSDRKGFFASSEVGNDTTNLSSNGKLENTLDMTGKADQLLFDSSRINPSFNMDQVMLDYYPEYQMLKKLQTLTCNFTCNKCWKVLQFEKFFDDDHECLRDEDALQQNHVLQD